MIAAQVDGLPVRVHRLPVAGPGARARGARGAVRAPGQVCRRRGGHAGRARAPPEGPARRLRPGAGPALLREDHLQRSVAATLLFALGAPWRRGAIFSFAAS